MKLFKSSFFCVVTMVFLFVLGGIASASSPTIAQQLRVDSTNVAEYSIDGNYDTYANLGMDGRVIYNLPQNASTVVVRVSAQKGNAIFGAYFEGDNNEEYVSIGSVSDRTYRVREGATQFIIDCGSSLFTSGSFTPCLVWEVTVNAKPASVRDLTATSDNAEVNLSWTASRDATSYIIKRSTTTGGPYETIANNITGTMFTDANVTNGTIYYYVVSAVNQAGESENSNEVSALSEAPGTIKINFQPAGLEIPEEYIPDYGEIYGVRNGYSYGWNVGYTGATRDRNINADQKLDTLIMLYKTGKWEMEVEDGFYDVTVCAGDAGFTSTPTVNVEGVNYWAGINLGANLFSQITKTVMVTDGRLTIDNGGTTDQITKINYVKIVKSSVTLQAPINIHTTAAEDSVAMSWDVLDNASGYEVEADGQSYTVTEPIFNHQWLEANSLHTYRVRAVNDGIKGTWSEPVTVTTLSEAPGTIKINFQPAGVEIPQGYIPDYGDVYGVRNGYNYGWNVGYVGATRDRNISADQKLDTLIMLYKTAKWEMELEDGFYDVTVCAGDAGFTSKPTVNVEGVNYWAGINLGANQFSKATKTVMVTDGRLTIDNAGTADTVTKIDYVKIVKSSVTLQAPINIHTTAAEDSVAISWDKLNNAAVYEVEEDGQSYTVTEPIFNHQWLEANSTHTYRIRAVNDGIKGTWSEPVTVTTLSEAPGTIKINFQPAGVEIPQGYIPDYGEIYGVRNGYNYGWNVGYVGATRDRNISTNQKLDTLIMLYKTGKWEMGVEDGFYDVTVCAGDAGFTSTPTVNVEGVNYWAGINLGANQFSQVTKTVMVIDGRLTIDNGGTADQITKINYVKIAKSNVTLQAPLNINTTAAEDNVAISWDVVDNAAGYEVEADGQSYIVTKPLFSHQLLEANTSHTYRVRAVNDGIKGTWSEPITVTTLSEALDISIGDTTVNEADGTANFTVSLSGTCNRDVAVSYTTPENTAAAEDDYTSNSGTIVIPAGNTAVTIAVPISDDTNYEESESFYLKLTRTSAGRITNSQGECIINDNDSPPSVNLNISGSNLSENGGTSTITAVLSNKSYQDVTIILNYSGTAINGTDYIAPGTIVIPAGSLSNSITLTGIDNKAYEADKTVIADILDVKNGTENGMQQVTATIAEDDTFSSQYLSDIKISSGSLSPTFNKNVYRYTATVSSDVASINVIPTAEIAEYLGQNAKIVVNGTLVTSSSGIKVDLNLGENIINVDVTSAVGGVTQRYTLVVTRVDTYLSTMTIKASKKQIVNDFNMYTTNYTEISPSITALTITPTANDPNNVTIFVNGTVVKSGSSINVPVTSGETNNISIIVKSNINSDYLLTYNFEIKVGS